jgi:hypothetical protein
MSNWVPIRGISNVPKWQIAICALLIVLVVYNPFLTAPETSANTCFRHTPSHRATVGASELQHFTPTSGRSILATAGAAILLYLGRLALPAPHALRYKTEPLSMPPQFLPASLWFRPPPAV